MSSLEPLGKEKLGTNKYFLSQDFCNRDEHYDFFKGT